MSRRDTDSTERRLASGSRPPVPPTPPRADPKRAWRSSARASPGVQPALIFLGRRIRAIRLELALSQQAAAARAEIDPNHWQVIEQGGTNPTVASLVAVARALKVPLGELFRG